MPKSPKKTIEDHISAATPEMVSLFEVLRKKLIDMGRVKEEPRNNYIGYWLTSGEKLIHLFAEVHIRKTKLDIHIRKAEYKYQGRITINEKPATHKWTLPKTIDLYDENSMPDILNIVKQSYHNVIDSY